MAHAAAARDSETSCAAHMHGAFRASGIRKAAYSAGLLLGAKDANEGVHFLGTCVEGYSFASEMRIRFTGVFFFFFAPWVKEFLLRKWVLEKWVCGFFG